MTCRTAVNRTYDQPPVQKNDTLDALREFAQCASAVRDLLYDDRPLDDEQFLFMNNHCQNLQTAYRRWQQRHRPDDEHKPADD